MKRTGSAVPAGAFMLNKLWNGKAEIRFYENVEEKVETSENGEPITSWEYDEYIIERPYFEGIEDTIHANYDAWLSQAKAEEEAMFQPDAHQLRADIDFILAMEGLS